MSSSIAQQYLGGGQPGANGADGSTGLVLLGEATASSSASLEFTDISSTYKKVILICHYMRPVNNGVAELRLRTSANNGSSYDSGASDYQYNARLVNSATQDSLGDTAHDCIPIGGFNVTNGRFGSASPNSGSIYAEIHAPGDSDYTKVIGYSSYRTNFNVHVGAIFGGLRASAAAVDAIQLSMSSGNISIGRALLYGVKAS